MFIIKILFCNSFIFNNFIIKNNFKLNNNLKMEYFDESLYKKSNKIDLISSFESNIIINNWLNYYNIDNKSYFNEKNDDNILKNSNFILKSIYDFKVYLSINKNLNNQNNLYFYWNPNNNNKILYLIGCELKNEMLYIERIAQNPNYNNILDIKSYVLIEDIYNNINKNKNINNNNIVNISTTNLYNYDIRWKLSWGYYM